MSTRTPILPHLTGRLHRSKRNQSAVRSKLIKYASTVLARRSWRQPSYSSGSFCFFRASTSCALREFASTFRESSRNAPTSQKRYGCARRRIRIRCGRSHWERCRVKRPRRFLQPYIVFDAFSIRPEDGFHGLSSRRLSLTPY